MEEETTPRRVVQEIVTTSAMDNSHSNRHVQSIVCAVKKTAFRAFFTGSRWNDEESICGNRAELCCAKTEEFVWATLKLQFCEKLPEFYLTVPQQNSEIELLTLSAPVMYPTTF